MEAGEVVRVHSDLDGQKLAGLHLEVVVEPAEVFEQVVDGEVNFVALEI